MGNLLDSCPKNWTFTANVEPCMFSAASNPLPYREYAQYGISLGPAEVGQFDMVLTVVSDEGDVDIKLLGPDGSVIGSSAERVGSDVVIARRTDTQRLGPGTYTLAVQAVGGALSTYTITVQGVPTARRLAAAELALLSSVADQCCAFEDDDQLPDTCTRLRAATAGNATADQDICNTPPNVCDSAGRLVKLVLSGGDTGNFVCPTFPAELGRFPALTVLDWTSNGQVGTLSTVVSVLRPLLGTGQLRRLYLGSNALSGPLAPACDLLAAPGLEVLWMDANVLEGPVPSCLFSSPSLLQLSLSGNLLTGPLPPLPAGCALVSLDVSDNGPPAGPSPSSPGLSGPLPASITNAAKMRYLDISSNSFSGTLPALPTSLQVLRGSDNLLAGPLPASLDATDDLRVLDLSRNSLSGTLPRGIVNNELLTVLRLASNRLVGDLPFAWGEYLVDVDLADNGFTGTYTKLWYQPSLIRLNLANNNLSLHMEDLALGMNGTVNSLLYFNISHNNISGRLEAGLGGMRLFNSLQLQPDDVDALTASAAEVPPQPLFDIRGNLIRSVFPTWLLPLLGQLYWMSPYDWIPLSLELQPQKPAPAVDSQGATPGLMCPADNAVLPGNLYYLDQLQALYDLTCVKMPFDQVLNISSYNDKSLRPMAPPKPPAPPRPPPPSPPRPPRRRSNSTATPSPEPDSTDTGTDPSGGGTGTGSTPGSGSGTSNGTGSTGGTGNGNGSGGGTLQPGDTGGAGGGSTSKDTSTGGSGSSTGGSGSGGTGAGAGGSGNSNTGGSGSGGVNAGDGTTQPDGGSSSGGSSMGAIIGGAVAGVAVLALAGVGYWWYRQRQARNAAYASRRLPLTHNTLYEPAPSDGTASNYADLQMFEFRADGRPARHRPRMA
ncbi:hypothetical protein CHLRE_03g144324v5 [Chlamydomonas reinhardtii]|uniref:Uncharacterized protein n=1 Tax=Chlamydomonas reinhardtii TaxID=3055 RepID=A0A2K3DV32_CHLRE|nr:uncharacterized protein CHLRE_03g144324v5 [Chlamydomonas reinhardtii]PNW84407.1 hypothetical protein CHLRE_03g144324v5 [Chlamydomonas reinhardtii]